MVIANIIFTTTTFYYSHFLYNLKVNKRLFEKLTMLTAVDPSKEREGIPRMPSDDVGRTAAAEAILSDGRPKQQQIDLFPTKITALADTSCL